MAEPVSIRTNNPGAMWGGTHAKKWGATADLVLNDGQRNHIAVFPTVVQGGAAQFDLWRISYTGMTLATAIKRWSGSNSSPAYAAFLKRNAGVDQDQVITSDFLAGPRGLALMKAQAQWEAGKPYPMTDAQWAEAQAMVFKGAKLPPTPKPRVTPARPKVTPISTAPDLDAQLKALEPKN